MLLRAGNISSRVPTKREKAVGARPHGYRVHWKHRRAKTGRLREIDTSPPVPGNEPIGDEDRKLGGANGLGSRVKVGHGSDWR